MAKTTIHVCVTCRITDEPAELGQTRAGARLHREVARLAAERNLPVDIVPVECLSVCKRPCTIGFAAPGKWTYIYGDFSCDADAETILAGARLYADAPDGLIPWRKRPDALKKGVISRSPPLSTITPSARPEAAE